MPKVQGLEKAKDEEPVCVDIVSSVLVYVGYPIPGRGEDVPGWAISKVFQDGTVWKTHWVDGTKEKLYVWEDRADYDYYQNID